MAFRSFFSLVAIIRLSRCEAYYLLDGKQIGRRFDGIGGLSGGGATSRLLVDYDSDVRDHLLDLLFKPRYGASLHILKHEIGGDTFSGCGTEPSHMHSADDESYSRGYEWWLMEEAEKRRPGIIGYGLPWGFPAWVKGHNGTELEKILSNATANYIARWVQGAQEHHGHQIQYVGIWNERQFTTDYIKTLRKELNKHGAESTKIVVADLGPGSDPVIWQDMQDDPELRNIVDVIGVHYPQGSTLSAAAQASGVTLWSSEDSSTVDDARGAGCWARISNWNYVYGNMTSTIMWNLISSYYRHLYWYGDSFMDAAEPWSGNYTIRDPLWAVAHTTQFTEVGWDYLKHGAGSGVLRHGGSYVTFISPDRKDFSIVVEAMTKEHSLCIRNNPQWDWNVSVQDVALHLENLPVANTADRAQRELSVWKSCFFEPAGPFTFQRQDNLLVNSSGYVNFRIEPDCIVTLSTTSGQSKAGGSEPSFPSTNFPVPYSDQFSGYGDDKMAKYFSDQTGSFSVNASAGALQQRVFVSPTVADTKWGGDSVQPISIIGTYHMVDYEVAADVVIPAASSQTYPSGVLQPTNAVLAARVGGSLSGDCDNPDGCVQGYADKWYDYGYYLFVNVAPNPGVGESSWQLFVGGKTLPVLNGTFSADQIALGKRFRMSLSVRKSTLIARFGSAAQDMRTLGTYDDKANTFQRGFAAIGCGWHDAQFHSFALANVTAYDPVAVI